MADNEFKSTVETLFKGMESFISSKTVVGEPIHVGDTIILPLVDVTFGVGAGAAENEKKSPNAGGGIGGKLSPTALLIINKNGSKIVSCKSQDGLSKILDMVPDMVNKFTNKGSADTAEELAEEIGESIE